MSTVWKYFTKLKHDKGQAKCNLCFKSYKTAGTTTNLFTHLRNKHYNAYSDVIKEGRKKPVSRRSTTVLEEEDPDDPQDVTASSSMTFTAMVDNSSESMSHAESLSSRTLVSEEIQPTFPEFLKLHLRYGAGGEKDREITEAVIYMIFKDNLSLNTVEKTGFKFLMKKVCPMYRIPSRQTIANLLHSKYTSIKGALIAKIKAADSISLTADICTILNSTRSFLIVTAHFVDVTEMQSVFITANSLDEKHTGQYIAEQLQHTIQGLEITSSRIVSVTTDGAMNITKSIEIFLSADKRISCFAHLLNLVVQDAIKLTTMLEEILNQVKKIVAYFKHSNVAMDSLRKEQKKMGKTEGTVKYLSQDVATRWNSTHDMLQKFEELAPVVATVLASRDHKDGPQMLAGSHLEVIAEVICVLHPFKEATTEISGDKYITGSMILPLTHCLIDSLNKIHPATDVAKELLEHLKSGITDRLKPLERNKLLCIATIMDPRFKRLYTFSPINQAAAITQLCQELKCEMLRATKGLESSEKQELPPIPKQHKNSIWTSHEERVNQAESDYSLPSHGTMPPDLKMYFNAPCVPLTDNPLQYWHKNHTFTPVLATLALKYLTVMGTSVSSERAVSALNNIVADNRSRFTSEHINQRVFLACIDDKYWCH